LSLAIKKRPGGPILTSKLSTSGRAFSLDCLMSLKDASAAFKLEIPRPEELMLPPTLALKRDAEMVRHQGRNR